MDAHKNFAWSTVATAPSPAASGTSLVVAAGEGAAFPAVPFNAVVCPAGTQPTNANAEIIRVTARSTDTFSTIVRAQEGTAARTVVVGDQVFAAVTAQSLTDIERTSPQWWMSNSANIVESYPRLFGGSPTSGIMTPGVMFLVAVPLYAGTTVTNITFRVGTTAAGTPTNWWFALYDGGTGPATTINLIGTTADQLTAAMGSASIKTLPLITPYPVVTTGTYYVAAMVAAATTPTLLCFATYTATGGGIHVTGQYKICGTTGSALTTPATAPATITNGSLAANDKYLWTLLS